MEADETSQELIEMIKEEEGEDFSSDLKETEKGSSSKPENNVQIQPLDDDDDDELPTYAPGSDDENSDDENQQSSKRVKLSDKNSVKGDTAQPLTSSGKNETNQESEEEEEEEYIPSTFPVSEKEESIQNNVNAQDILKSVEILAQQPISQPILNPASQLDSKVAKFLSDLAKN